MKGIMIPAGELSMWLTSRHELYLTLTPLIISSPLTEKQGHVLSGRTSLWTDACHHSLLWLLMTGSMCRWGKKEKLKLLAFSHTPTDTHSRYRRLKMSHWITKTSSNRVLWKANCSLLSPLWVHLSYLPSPLVWFISTLSNICVFLRVNTPTDTFSN